MYIVLRMNSSVQVPSRYYFRRAYNSLERFISYFHQADLVSELEPETILEVGMGSGLLSSHLRSLGVKVTTCDFDESVCPDVVSDVRSLPFEDKSFDVSIACEVLEHLPFSEVGLALSELARVSRRAIIVSVPYCSTGWEFVFRFPFIRRFLGRAFLSGYWRWPLKFWGFEESGQHYWEIDRKEFRLDRVRKLFSSVGKITREFSPPLDRYQYFFIISL